MIAEVIAPHDVDAIWPEFADQVVRCLEKTPHPDLSAADFWTMCRSGMAFLIVIHDGEKFLAMSVWRFDEKKFSCLLLVGRQMSRWLKLLVEKATAIARMGGGTGTLIASGRVGLGASLRKAFPQVRVTRQTYEVTI